jgi:flavin reductase (DIM6/NTAB) family NADH-FMN oxidoreductase RutF
MLGLGQMGQTSDNLIRTRECVTTLPSEDLVTHVDRLALTTGKNPVPERKRQWGYCYEPDKFGIAGFTPVGSELVAPRGCASVRYKWKVSSRISALSART